ncbi:MAG: phosphoribosylanthranilate isomerase [Gammaproteobacteria bacterium]|nr:phosphoribosylanthranilate isomerase [Gammaproteobacteria bacterium]
MRTRIKICGITRPEDGLAAARAGADAIGLVFYAPSPRAIDIARAQAIVAALPPFVTVVALFVDPTEAEVETVLQNVAVDVLQFHGNEAPEFCVRFSRPYLKALRMREGIDLATEATRYASAQGLLLDAYKEGVAGGTGERFDWVRVPRNLTLPIILAGGLTPVNVAAAIQQARPYAIDVSGGVEAAKGIKDAAKMAALMGEVKRVES